VVPWHPLAPLFPYTTLFRSITLATLGVMGVGASLGPLRGASSAGVYLLLGAVGAPIFSDGQSGVMLPTFGYVVGYVLAAFIAGQLARRRADRRPVTTFALAALGTLVLYLCGGAWLAVSLGLDLRQTFLLGVAPFLLGDALKALALTVLLPSVWAVTSRREAQDRRGQRR